MFTSGACNCDVRTSTKQHTRFQITAVFAVTLLFTLSCHKEPVRISVSSEDILRANEISKEGELAFSQKEYYAALIKYLESLRLNPNNEYVYNRIGMAYSQLQLFDEATTAYARAIQLNSKYPFPYNNLGAVFFARGDFRKAEKYFKKAVKTKPGEASFHMNLGTVFLERKKTKEAVAEWRKALSLDPQALSAEKAVSLVGGGKSLMERSYIIARLHASAGKVEAAIRSLKEAVNAGFTDIADIRRHPDFDPVRKDQSFVEFMEELPLLIKLRPKD